MKNLKAIRLENGLTQNELARKVGATQQTVARWESGRAEPSIAVMRQLAVVLSTTIDDLFGRCSKVPKEIASQNFVYEGDKSAHWGNIGLLLSHAQFTRWYPVSVATMERVFKGVQLTKYQDWIVFKTLNNKMVALKPSKIMKVTLRNYICDEIEGDWNIGPDDIEGWPEEVYKYLTDLHAKKYGLPMDEDKYSSELIETARSLVDEHRLDERRLAQICSQIRIEHSDGTTNRINASEKSAADTFIEFQRGAPSTTVLLEDIDYDVSVFIHTNNIQLIEFPLVLLEKGLDEIAQEDGMTS